MPTSWPVCASSTPLCKRRGDTKKHLGKQVSSTPTSSSTTTFVDQLMDAVNDPVPVAYFTLHDK